MLISIVEAREILGNITLDEIYRLCKTKDFPAFQIGRKWKIDKGKLQNWIEKQLKHNPEDLGM